VILGFRRGLNLGLEQSGDSCLAHSAELPSCMVSEVLVASRSNPMALEILSLPREPFLS